MHDRRDGDKLTSLILPPYMRRTPSVEALIPMLCLKGISTNDFPEALCALLGENAADLTGKRYVSARIALDTALPNVYPVY